MDYFGIIVYLLLSKISWLTVIMVVMLHYYLTLDHDYFEKRGIKFVKPVPLFGNMLPTFLKRKSFVDIFNSLYTAFPNEKFIGIFEFIQPTYFIRDPELIKQITVKGFDHFVNHRGKIDDHIEPMFGRNLFSMTDQRWKDMRSILTPAFTASKVKNMLSMVVDCSNDIIEYLVKEANGKSSEYEMKDLYSRFTNDIIVICSFGIKVNLMKNRNNEFYEMGKVITNFDGVQRLKFFGFNAFPNLMKFLRISFFGSKTANFFRKLVQDTMEHREKSHIIRPDMINLLMQAKQGKSNHNDEKQDANVEPVAESNIKKANSLKINKWDDDDLTAQCVLFLLAGYDTVSLLLCFMAHELAVNQDIQDRLYEEVKAVKEQLNGNSISYEMLQKMKYMDMVISETLRKWSPNVAASRYCNKEFVLDDGNGTKVNLQPGDGVWMPMFSIHRDPKYFPNPETFDPERFSDANKGSINPSTYFPFGLGPRSCIGSRFALMETKVIMFNMLSAFRMEKSPKTQDPMKLKNDALSVKAERGFWLNLRPLITK